MDGRFQKRVQRYGWDKAAIYYEDLWREQLEPAQTALLDFADLVSGERVLDVACGTGLVAFRAASIVLPCGEVVGTDISEQMIATACDIARARDIANTVFHRMDAEQLALDGASFDVALCALGLMYVPHPEIALGEMHRETGDASVHRIADRVNDDGVGQRQVNEARIEKIRRHLVNNSQCARRSRQQFLDIA